MTQVVAGVARVLGDPVHDRSNSAEKGGLTMGVLEVCQRCGIEPPTFEERGGSVYVTFRAQILTDAELGQRVPPQVTPQVAEILKAAVSPCTRAELQQAAGLKDREHFRKAYLEPLLEAVWLEMTIPEKPRSSRQRYQTTPAGRRALEGR